MRFVNFIQPHCMAVREGGSLRISQQHSAMFVLALRTWAQITLVLMPCTCVSFSLCTSQFLSFSSTVACMGVRRQL